MPMVETRRMHLDKLLFLLPLMCSLDMVTGRPKALVAVSTAAPDSSNSNSSNNKPSFKESSPIISEFKVRSDIRFRYARTVVESYVKNPSDVSAQEISFTMVIPDTAFISNFSMLLQDKEYVASVREKAEAQQAFDQAVSGGQAAGLVSQDDARDANKITVSANVEPLGKVRFRLTYEELLKRRLEKYEHVVHINLGQVVDDFRVDVFINESLPLSGVSVPKFKTDPSEVTTESEANPDAKIVRDPADHSRAQVTFKPSAESQKNSSGISGQFIVRYDVDRRDEGNEVQTIDGYFVHFFAPADLPVLPKHVVFVLDVSGSMAGEKLVQTKDAMVSIIDDLTPQDFFSIVTFSDGVYKWQVKPEDQQQLPYVQGTQDNKNAALKHVLGLETIGGTNINDALVEAVDLVRTVRKSESLPGNVKPIVIFMTDGQPTSGTTSGALIRANVQEANKDLRVPIYGLAFGRDADFNLMRDISTDHKAFARRIYEGSDAAIQLEDFFQEIASPLLSDVKFDYVGELVDNATVTTTSFSSFSRGNEIVVAGKIVVGGDAKVDHPQSISVDISGEGAAGLYKKKLDLCVSTPIPFVEDLAIGQNSSSVLGCSIINPQPPPPRRSDEQNFVERLWAFLTIKDLLDEKTSKKDATKTELTNDKDHGKDTEERSNKAAALELALKYNFVTPITSLVVVRPNETSSTTVDLEPVTLSSSSSFSSSSLLFDPASSAAFASFGGSGHIASAQPSGSGGGGGFTNHKGDEMHYLPEEIDDENYSEPAGPAPSFTPIITTTTMVHTTHLPWTTTPTTILSNHPEPSPSAPPKTSCSGSVTLFSQTYLRGSNVILADDEADLSKVGFGRDLLTSLEVKGDCCWQVSEAVGHEGKEVRFAEGAYKSASEMREVFRNAASVKKLFQCY